MHAVTAVESGKRALELLGTVRFFYSTSLLFISVLFFSQWVMFIMCVVWFQEPNVSMIITDYWMPEMTGYELLKKVKVHASFNFLSALHLYFGSSSMY